MSQIVSPFRSKDRQETVNPVINEERLLEAARSDTSGQVDMIGPVTDCPQFKIWQRDKLLTVYEIGQVGDSMAIKHRGEITKTARECQVSMDRVIVKIGVAGRVLLGPKGQAGTITLPMLLHITDRTRNIIATKKLRVSVTMSPGNPVGYFSTVDEIPVTLAPGTRAADYDLFVAFDRSVPGAG